ncbi:MAG: LLM class flavin-dependent oxidoreductase [Candidatus Caldarchaeum sp.]
MGKRIGLVFLSDHYGPVEFFKLAVKAEKAGVGTVWLAEHYCSTEAFSVLGAVAARTRRIRIGSSIVSSLIRHPVTVATAASSLAELSGGRFVLGVGAGARRWVEDYLGLPYSPVLSRMTEAVKLIRNLLTDNGGDFQGRWFRAMRARITPKPPSHRVPVYLGAVGEKMRKLAFQLADGLILSAGSSLGYVRQTHEELLSLRLSKPYEVVALTFTSINRDSQAAKEALKPELASILSRPGRAETMLAEYRLEAEWFERLRTATERGDKAILSKLISDDMVDQLAAAGTMDECMEYLSKLAKLRKVSTALVPIGTEIKTLFKLMERFGENYP